MICMPGNVEKSVGNPRDVPRRPAALMLPFLCADFLLLGFLEVGAEATKVKSQLGVAGKLHWEEAPESSKGLDVEDDGVLGPASTE